MVDAEANASNVKENEKFINGFLYMTKVHRRATNIASRILFLRSYY